MSADPLHPCRFCGAQLDHVFLDLGCTPLANSYVSGERAATPDTAYPLLVHVCDACLLVQAQPVVPAEDIFSDYAYFSSYSTTWLSHAARYCDAMTEHLGLDQNSFVVEIASNDGYLLRNFVARGIPCLGVEPAANVAEVAITAGVPTEVLFFGEATAQDIRNRHRAADLIAANNVLAHVPDLNDFVRGFKVLLAPGGTITVEFPHLLELIRHVQFDTIYHEHYSYFSLLALERIFRHHGLCIFDVEQLTTHGGSLRIFACHDDDARADHPGAGLETVLSAEIAAHLDRPRGYDGMAPRVTAITKALTEFLAKARADGKSVAAWGAAAKGNTLLNFAGVTDNDIAFVVDRNPAKQGLLLPGSRIPVASPDRLAQEAPDYLLILPWNLAQEISAEAREITTWRGQFVVAIPHLTIWS